MGYYDLIVKENNRNKTKSSVSSTVDVDIHSTTRCWRGRTKKAGKDEKLIYLGKASR